VWGEKTCWRGRFQIALSVGKEAARGGGGWDGGKGKRAPQCGALEGIKKV